MGCTRFAGSEEQISLTKNWYVIIQILEIVSLKYDFDDYGERAYWLIVS